MNKNVIVGLIVAVLIVGGAAYYFLNQQGKFTHDNLRYSIKCAEEWKMFGAEELQSAGLESAQLGCIAPDDSTSVMLQVSNNVKKQTSEEAFEELIWAAGQAGAIISDRHTEQINGKEIHFHSVSKGNINQGVAIFATENYIYSLYITAEINKYNAFYPGFEETLNNLDVW